MLRKVKIYSLLVLTCLAMSHWSYGEVFEPPQVNISVTVVDEDGRPIKGAQVQGLFKGLRAAVDDTVVKKLTDSEGVTQLSGKSRFPVSVTARKEGYYPSMQENVATVEWDKETKNYIFSDEAVSLVLRAVKNPVPMHAFREAKAKVPELHKPFGYDLLAGDWVSPHGEGKVEDVVFELTGEWTSFDNHDSYLHITFPNPGDGIQSFSANSQSAFKSPYEAPVDGYASEKSLRKMRRSVLVEGFRDKYKTTSVDETSHAANYIIRVRTVINEKGEVVSALYGKIYGDFVFYGATLEKRYRPVVFSYYLNPTANDRNLEYDPKQNLLKGITSWNQPDAP